MPWGLRLSLHSPQPTRPSSVSTRTNVQGLQPPSQCSASTRAIFIGVSPLDGFGSEPGRQASPELVQLEQPDPAAVARGGSCLRRVVAPGSQDQPDVPEIGMRGDVLERLQPVLDEPERRAPPARSLKLGDERAQVLALVDARFLALDVGQLDMPAIQDQAG